jgi:rRNA maturation RNase YbeY
MQKQFENLSITRETTGKLPACHFCISEMRFSGKDYELSLVFIGRAKAIQMHKDWKSKNDPVNILSFPLSKKKGEIFISLEKARSECKHFDRAYENYLAFLFIHGCVHLKGSNRKMFSIYLVSYVLLNQEGQCGLITPTNPNACVGE